MEIFLIYGKQTGDDMSSLEPVALLKDCWWLQRAELDGQIVYAK